MMQNLSDDGQFEIKLNLLQEVLDKKHAALAAVLTICENQEQLHLAPPSDARREFLLEMGKEKQRLIEEVMTCDEVFQRLFDSIADVFEENSRAHTQAARKLQESISDVIELDVKIRAQEQKSRAAVGQALGQAAAEINPANTNYILNQYRSHKKPGDGAK